VKDQTASDRPPKNGWPGIRLYLILSVIALAGAALCVTLLKEKQSLSADGSHILEIVNAASGKVYSRCYVKDGDEFAIEFVHSVNNSPVREIFKVDGNEICPVAVRFYSFGAGMQSDLEEGQKMSRDGDAVVISGFNRPVTELSYIVGTVSDHLLLVNGQTISLRDLCGKNAHIKIRIKGTLKE
jgi:hypothetical protein